MKKYDSENNSRWEVTCNKCGKIIYVNQDIPQEDTFHAEKTWGYFSQKDGIRQTWDLCEDCYENFVRGFVIPPEELELTEIL